MTLNEIGIVLGITTSLIGGAGYFGKLVGDTYWISSESYYSQELRKTQRERSLLEWERDNGGLSPRQQFELRQLEDLEKQLLLELQ